MTKDKIKEALDRVSHEKMASELAVWFELIHDLQKDHESESKEWGDKESWIAHAYKKSAYYLEKLFNEIGE